MSLSSLLISAAACTVAVLVALWSGSIWRRIAERIERRVELQLHEDRATPRDTLVKAGVITIVLLNGGQEPCRLYIRSAETELASPSIRPGRRREWTVHLDPGTYHLSLSLADQGRQGQQGLLRVVPAFGPGERA